MALPKLQGPTYPITFPLCKKKTVYTSYGLGEEKLLIAGAAARESDPKFFVDNTLKALDACLVEAKGLVYTLAAVDVEYLMMMLRSKSVGEIVSAKTTDPVTKKVSQVEVDLTKFYITDRNADDYIIQLTDTIGMKMKEPTFLQKTEHAARLTGATNKSDIIFELIVDSIESIYEEDNVSIVGNGVSREEVYDFVMQIKQPQQKQKLYEFVRNTPQLMIKIDVDGVIKEVAGNQIDFLASPTATST